MPERLYVSVYVYIYIYIYARLYSSTWVLFQIRKDYV